MENIFYESYMEYFNGNISESTLDAVILESSAGRIKKLNKYLDKITEIKNAKPAEYADNKQVKVFVDKHYDDIIKCSKYLEDDVADLKRSEFLDIVKTLLSMIAGYGSLLLVEKGTLGLVFGIAGMTLGVVIIPLVLAMIRGVRASKDSKLSEELLKIRTALKRLKVNKMDITTKNKISDICTAIDDADTEVSAHLQVSKESVDDIKLSIYEAYDNGDINESEKYDLLNSLENSAELFEEETRWNKEYDKKHDEYERLIQQIEKLKRIYDTTPSDKTKTAIKEKIHKLKDEADKLERFSEPSNKAEDARIKKSKSSQFGTKRDRGIVDRKYRTKRAMGMDDSNRYEPGPSKLEQRPAGTFAKESADDIKLSIYEAYDNGEITEAEKYALLESLDD